MKSKRTAFGLTFEEFCQKTNNNTPQTLNLESNKTESFTAYLKKGSQSLKTNPMIQKALR